MSTTQTDSAAVALARTQVEAWANHDFDAARNALAPDVHVTVTSTNPALPHVDLTGVDNYMEGLIAYAQPVVPGSVQVIASTGDDHNALLLLTLTMAGGPFGTGITAPCARLYLIENGKIKTEQVIFYLAQD